MKYIVCPAKDCSCPLWGCRQNGKFFRCSDCYDIPGEERTVQCPKEAEVEDNACPVCRQAPQKR